jgi:hypothetical protein
VLEWVYGTIVSTAEKARDGAKRALGGNVPAPEEGHFALLRALEEQQAWESKLQQVCLSCLVFLCVHECVCVCVCVCKRRKACWQVRKQVTYPCYWCMSSSACCFVINV